MSEFLEKLGLIDHFQTVLKVDKIDFVNALAANIDEPQSIFGLHNIFSPSKNAYNGSIHFDSFELKRNRKFSMKNYSTVAKGEFTQRGGELVIDIEVNGFPKQMIAYYVILIFFYPFFVWGLFMSGVTNGMPTVLQVIMLSFVIVQGVLMCGMPIFMMRRGVRSVRYELERDLFYMIRNKRATSQYQR